jgi:hypothetical protein
VTVYVDPLVNNGWRLRGRGVRNCHLFTDGPIEELHAIAATIGMKREWFQGKASTPHYDLTPVRRAAAIEAGAVPVDRRQAVAIWRAARSPQGSRA